MKKKLALIAAVVFAISLTGCGSDESKKAEPETTAESTEITAEEETTEESTEEVIDISGTYQNVSLFCDSVYQLNENGTYDRTTPEEKGTYVVEANGDIMLTEKGVSNSEDTFTPYLEYYYLSNCPFGSDSEFICFSSDEEYGAKPAFDENGKSNQTFKTGLSERADGNDHQYEFKMNEDGTFSVQEEVGVMQNGFMMMSDGDKYEGEYELNDAVLTLKCNDIEYKLLFIDEKIYYNVLMKHTEETEDQFQKMQAVKEAIFEPVDEALANEVSGKFQGQWEYTNGAAKYTLTFDGYNIVVDCIAGGYQITNQGTYIVCKDLLLVTYENGKQATIRYTYENGELNFSPLVGLDE